MGRDRIKKGNVCLHEGRSGVKIKGQIKRKEKRKGVESKKHEMTKSYS